MNLANFRILSPNKPLQGPASAGGGSSSVTLSTSLGSLPWVVVTPGGVVSVPNPVAVAAAEPPVPSASAPGPPTLVSATAGNQSIILVWAARSLTAAPQ